MLAALHLATDDHRRKKADMAGKNFSICP